MDIPLLQAVYNSEDFAQKGHQLIALIADHLKSSISGTSEKVISWKQPDKALEYWKNYDFKKDTNQFFNTVLKQSTIIHHPKYIGHQVAPTAPLTLLTSMVSAYLNNGSAVYEMGMVSNPIERIITDLLCTKIGYDKNSGGFLTSGGTLANLTALLSARKAILDEDIWSKGSTTSLGIMVSEEAHYCIERAAKIMGLGEKGLIKIPSNENYEIDTSLLQSYYDKAKVSGIQIFAIVGSAPCTATGSFDSLEILGSFAQQNKLWFHVDGAHGGAAISSKQYRPTLKGIKQADSVVIDGHKMMMMPGVTTALLYKENRSSYATFSQKADYLLDASEDQDWYNSGKRTFECTKNMMCLHWYLLLKTYGEGVFDEFVTTLYGMGQQFGEMLKADPAFELAITPMSNIVCFRIIKTNTSNAILNKLNAAIRQELLEEGTFYIVQTILRDIIYFRVTIMNPFTTEEHLHLLLATIKEKALAVRLS